MKLVNTLRHKLENPYFSVYRIVTDNPSQTREGYYISINEFTFATTIDELKELRMRINGLIGKD